MFRTFRILASILALGICYVSLRGDPPGNPPDDIEFPAPPGVPQEVWDNTPPEGQAQAQQIGGFWYLAHVFNTGSGQRTAGPASGLSAASNGYGGTVTASASAAYTGPGSGGAETVASGTIDHYWFWYPLRAGWPAPSGSAKGKMSGELGVNATATGTGGAGARSHSVGPTMGTPTVGDYEKFLEVSVNAANAPVPIDSDANTAPHIATTFAPYGGGTSIYIVSASGDVLASGFSSLGSSGDAGASANFTLETDGPRPP